MKNATHSVIENALAILGEAPSADTAYAVSAMVQGYIYGAYPHLHNMIRQDELSKVLVREAHSVAVSWDGWEFANRGAGVACVRNTFGLWES